MASLGSRTARSAIWSGQLRDHLRQFHSLIRSKLSSAAGEGPFTDFVSRHPDATERNAYVKTLEFDLILGNGEMYPHKGNFYALDRSLDPKTGSIRYYVTFPNPGNILRPGQFGKVRFVADMKKGAMVIPQEAVNELQGSFQVAVVDENNKVSIRPVKMGERIGAMWEITEGLKPGDKVVVQGLQKAREGSIVAVKDWTPPARRVGFKSRPAKEALGNVRVFRQAAHRRDCHRHFDDADRRRLHAGVADRAISADRAAGNPGADALHRRGRANSRAIGRGSDRAADERCR